MLWIILEVSDENEKNDDMCSSLHCCSAVCFRMQFRKEIRYDKQRTGGNALSGSRHGVYGCSGSDEFRGRSADADPDTDADTHTDADPDANPGADARTDT